MTRVLSVASYSTRNWRVVGFCRNSSVYDSSAPLVPVGLLYWKFSMRSQKLSVNSTLWLGGGIRCGSSRIAMSLARYGSVMPSYLV